MVGSMWGRSSVQSGFDMYPKMLGGSILSLLEGTDLSVNLHDKWDDALHYPESVKNCWNVSARRPVVPIDPSARLCLSRPSYGAFA